MAIVSLAGPAPAQIIGVDSHASAQEALAAREVERYTYLRTGRLLPIKADRSGRGIFVVRKGRRLLGSLRLDAKTRLDIASLRPQEYLVANLGGDRCLIVGGDDTGVLYGAYRFAEKLGVRFYLHGDVIPDRRISFRMPKGREIGRPLFALRGINPFHDFPEGPDWWNRDDYLATIGQLPKLRMNFLGLHTYPEGGVGPEPGVWIGQKNDLLPDGRVSFSYPSSWANTLRPGSWGYDGGPTSQFSSGAADLFAEDNYGPAVMKGSMPRPATPPDSNRLFNDVGQMLRDAFAEARFLGVKTCVGTETPLTIPRLVQDRLRAKGKDVTSSDVVRSLYEAMFTRIARLCPVDYYWLWTPEDWTWSGNTPEQLKKTTDDLHAALAALDSIGNPFRLATCGWVLGPQNDRAALDRVLPKNVAVSTINQSVGNAPVEPGFGKIVGRSKWAIPWMENDPSLTAPQLWVGRMLYDAADAKRLGCDGLIGIHWRTKALGPNVSALASAAWDQSWKPAGFDHAAAELTSGRMAATGAIGGNVAQFAAPVVGAAEQAVYQTVRYDMTGYDIPAPNGAYTVTLQFNEPFYTESGKRVFGVKLQGQTVIDGLDLFKRVGQNHALDFTFKGIVVKNRHLRIDFIKQVEFPCIAGIVVTGTAFTRKINCGGSKTGEYIGELDAKAGPDPQARGVPTAWFYEDFARANFGETVAREAGALLAKVDGMNLPRPASWLTGPGDIVPNQRPWSEVVRDYAFVDRFASLGPHVQGAGNVERFDYWLNTFQYMKAMGMAGCQRGQLDLAMQAIAAQADPATRRSLAEHALPIRLAMTATWERMMGYLEATVGSPGELGTICNVEQHVRLHAHFLDAHDAALAKALAGPLPATVEPTKTYQGPARLVVPTVRTSVAGGERLSIDVILTPPMGSPRAALHWRKLGVGPYSDIPLQHVRRSVYRVVLPAVPANANGIEYYIEARFVQAGVKGTLTFPATAPAINQTVVVIATGP